jgi:hypothetical protein
MPLQQGEFFPLGLVTPPLRPSSGDFFNIYGHYWDETYEWANKEKGGVVGFTQLGAWWNTGTVNGHYWAWEDGIGFPAHAPDAFLKVKGDNSPFSNILKSD